MPWALVKHWKNNEIVRKADTKYELLKWGIETKEPINKKTIARYKDGDFITVIYRKEYEKWQQSELTGRYYKEPFQEVNEVIYTLRYFEIQFGQKNKRCC